MANYWIINNELDELINQLTYFYEPYLGSIYRDEVDMLKTAEFIRDAFFLKYVSYNKYINYIRIEVISTKQKINGGYIYKMNDFEIHKIL